MPKELHSEESRNMRKRNNMFLIVHLIINKIHLFVVIKHSLCLIKTTLEYPLCRKKIHNRQLKNDYSVVFLKSFGVFPNLLVNSL